VADVSLIRAGRWGLSRPLFIDGGWTTYAMEQHLGSLGAENYFPPRQADGTPLCNAVLVRLSGTITAPSDGNTVLFPRNLADLGDVTLGELTANQRNALRNTLESWLTGYTFTDWDGQRVTVPSFTERTATYTADTTLKEVARHIFRHMAHSVSRPKPSVFESHNTEYLDDFSTDPFSAPRWTNELGTMTWDSVNAEMAAPTTAVWGCRYSINGPGSMDHESQVTHVIDSDSSHCGGPAVRMHNTGTDDWYAFTVLDWNNQNLIEVNRINAGVRSTLAQAYAFTLANNDWITQRAAASGGAGANVVLDVWATNHGTTKPSDPGWIGVDASPPYTYTDSEADRLDDAAHVHCGMAARHYNHDSRHSYWKSRAISDRSGVADTTLEASLTGTASLAAALTTQIHMAAALTGSGALAGALTTQITMEAQLNATGALLAALTTEIRLAAAISGSGTLAGSLQTDIQLAAALQGLGSVTAALTTQIQMAAAFSGSGALAADLDAGSGTLSALLAGTAQLAAALSTQITLAAQLAGSGAVAAALTTEIRLAAQLAASGTLAGDLQTDTSLAAALAGSGSLQAALTTAIELQALLQGSGSLTADLLVAEIIEALNRIAVTLHVGPEVRCPLQVAAQIRREIET